MIVGFSNTNRLACGLEYRQATTRAKLGLYRELLLTKSFSVKFLSANEKSQLSLCSRSQYSQRYLYE